MEQKKQTLMVDMDGVLVRPNFKDDATKDYNIYEGCALLPGCAEILEKLNKKYELYIVTKFIMSGAPEMSGTILKDKFHFLQEKLPFIKSNQYVFIQDKLMLDFDIRIDDKPESLGDSKIKLLFNSPKNQDVHPEDLLRERIIRVNSWREIDKILV